MNFQTLTQDELEDAPDKVKDLVRNLRTELTEFVEETEESIELALAYISEKGVGKTSYADCLHIALATINRADLLI